MWGNLSKHQCSSVNRSPALIEGFDSYLVVPLHTAEPSPEAAQGRAPPAAIFMARSRWRMSLLHPPSRQWPEGTQYAANWTSLLDCETSSRWLTPLDYLYCKHAPFGHTAGPLVAFGTEWKNG